MNFKNLFLISLLIIESCRNKSLHDEQKTERIIAKSDSISQAVERSRIALDSLTDKAVKDAENSFNILNQTIDDYKKSEVNNSITKTKIVNRVDTIYFPSQDKILSVDVVSEIRKDDGQDYNEYQNRIKELEWENYKLREEITNLRNKKSESIISLKESLLRVDPIKKNWLNEEVKTKKAKNVQGIKIQFSLGEKEIENGGDLYLCITDPEGKEIGEEDNKIFISEDKQKIFIKNFTIDKNDPFVFLYFQNEKFKPGTYLIEFYQDNIIIKSGSITLTKGIL